MKRTATAPDALAPGAARRGPDRLGAALLAVVFVVMAAIFIQGEAGLMQFGLGRDSYSGHTSALVYAVAAPLIVLGAMTFDRARHEPLWRIGFTGVVAMVVMTAVGGLISTVIAVSNI